VTDFTQESFWQQVQSLLPINLTNNPTFCIGFSGGLDSSVLLHLLSEIQKANNHPSFTLKAIHINHQLQKDADLWEKFCQNFCDTRKIPFKALKVDITDTKKKGIEATARNARYATFRENLLADDILLTAHHLDDQVETVFLQLLRGTGIEGAAAINPCSKVGDYYLMRPLLDFSRDQLLAYAKKHHLDWVDDPSNDENDFNRNYLRNEVLPIIETRWPAYRHTIQRFSNNARSAKTVLDDYLSIDYMHCLNKEKNTLVIDSLLKLALEKRLMVIRFWVKQHNFSLPDEAILLQIHSALLAADDANPLIEWGDAVVRRYRNKLFIFSRKKNDFKNSEFHWNLKTNHTIKGLGVLSSQKVIGHGIHEKYANEKIKIAFRKGGEKCQLVGRQGSHSLKKLFQENAIPPWQREKIPLLLINNQIAGVVDYFYCSPFAAKKNEPGYIIKLDLELV